MTVARLCATVSMVALAVVPAILIGSVHRPAQIAAAALAAVALGCVVVARRAHGGTGGVVTWYGYVLLAFAFWTALQLIPLPVAWLATLAPNVAEVVSISSRALASPLTSFPLSLDPSATSWELLRLLTCAVAFVAALNYLHRERRRRVLSLALLATGTLMTLAGLLGAFFAKGKPWLLYTPSSTHSGDGLITTAFVNSNHGACFLAICTLLGVGLSLKSDRSRVFRFGVVAATIVCGVGVVLTLSRGGIAALAAGLLALLLLGYRQKNGSWIPLFVAIGLLAACAAFIPAVFREVSNTNVDKSALWGVALDMARQNPLFGVGKGAFATTVGRYLDPSIGMTASYTHAENQYVHLMAEVGVVVGGLLIILSAVAFVRWLKKAKLDFTTMAAAASLVAVAVQSIADFGLEFAGLAVPAAMLAGAVAAAAGRQQASRTSRGMTLAALAALVVAAIVIPVSAGQDAFASALTIKPGTSGWRRRARQVIRKHPADYFAHLVLARHERDHRKALSALGRTLALAPLSAAAHAEAARRLHLLGHRSQAILEYGLALRYGRPRRRLLERGVDLSRTTRELQTLLPSRPESFVSAIARLLRTRRFKLADALGRVASRRWPAHLRVRITSITATSSDGDRPAAIAAAKKLVASNPAVEAFRLLVRLLRAAKSADESVWLRKASQRHPGDVRFASDLARILATQRKYDDAISILERVKPYLSRPAQMAQVYDSLSQIHRLAGRLHRARWESQQARHWRQRAGRTKP
ncbi:MAG: O-antigen ligase family protein [Myxococcales bacterium]|nr:O-antigen ligase family protein [Myxococcales bacterium]